MRGYQPGIGGRGPRTLSLLRLWPRLFLDMLPRCSLLLAGSGVVLVPLFIQLRHSVAAEAAGAGGVAAATDIVAGASSGPAAGVFRLFLLVATLVLWEGIAAAVRRDGLFRMVFSRPVSRRSYFLARFGARLTCLLLLALVVAEALDRATVPSVPAIGRIHALQAAVVMGLFLGSLILVASAALDRGDALLIAALLVLEKVSIPGWAAPGGAVHPLAKTLLAPLTAFEDILRSLLTDAPVAAGSVVLVAVCGAALLGSGLLMAERREYGR